MKYEHTKKKIKVVIQRFDRLSLLHIQLRVCSQLTKMNFTPECHKASTTAMVNPNAYSILFCVKCLLSKALVLLGIVCLRTLLNLADSKDTPNTGICCFDDDLVASCLKLGTHLTTVKLNIHVIKTWSLANGPGLFQSDWASVWSQQTAV